MPKKNLTIEETFSLAVKNHQKNNLQIAANLYKETLKVNPDHIDANNNLGLIFGALGEFQKAIDCYEKAIQINPNYASVRNNLGLVFEKFKEDNKAISCYEKAIQINPYYAVAHFNLGNVLKKLGKFQEAKKSYQKAIQIRPGLAAAHNNLGDLLSDLGERKKAKSCYEKAIQINPNFTNAYWNLHSCASDIDEVLIILKKLYKIDSKFLKARIMISALQGFKGNFDDFNALVASSDFKHPYMRSIKWVFSLPKLPKIYFNRWDFFDAVVALVDKSRTFYEFGVWNGTSFQYLINTLERGFGFDTFTGLPEDWHYDHAGTYSSFGSVPKIEGGKFIVGKFEDTLPKFFSKKRPLASLINFDADLYSSTLCALNYSNKVIDEKSILIFDEFLMSEHWEQDEYRALNEFCDNSNTTYEVIAVSFFSKQVAVRLKKN